MFSKGKEGKQVQTVSEGTGPALGLLGTEPGCHHPGLSGLFVNNLERMLQGTQGCFTFSVLTGQSELKPACPRR